MNTTPQKPTAVSILPNLAAFLIGIGIAWFSNWKTRDLIWSLWLSSLVLGYLSILSAIGAQAITGARHLKQKEVAQKSRGKITGKTIFNALLLFAFFSFHFCAFHSAHASALQSYFPLDGLGERAFSGVIVNPFALWRITLTHIFPAYGLFLIATVIAERKNLIRPLRKVIVSGTPDSQPAAGVRKDRRNNPIIRPYINVFRMHILIFVFAVADGMNLDSFAIYFIVFALYFFPWSALFARNSTGSFSKQTGKQT